MNTTLQFDPALLRRYDRPGPRYTSYPSAPRFSSSFTETDVRRHAARSNEESIPRDLSLYVHVPFCFSPCFYCGCNRIITRDASRGAPYVERLLHEAELISGLFHGDREVAQVHFGGGTPNFLDAPTLRELIEGLARHFRFSKESERDFSIELDPRTMRKGDIAAYAEMGFNRASFGVQDFNLTVQRAINREQSVAQTLAVIEECRIEGFRSVNVDLIYGLPRQSIGGFRRTLDIVADARPDRIAVYGYAHLPQMFKAQRQIAEQDLPDAAARLDLLQAAIVRLSEAGYVYVGLDHFALPGDELSRALESGTLQRNFMGYTTHAACDLVGLGVSAISHVGDSFSQNHRDLVAWEAAVDQGRLPINRGLTLDDDDVIRAEVIQELMCSGKIDRAGIAKRYAIDFDEYFADSLVQLVPLESDGLVEVTAERIVATSRGRLMLRIVAMCFDRYLPAQPVPQTGPRHSRAV